MRSTLPSSETSTSTGRATSRSAATRSACTRSRSATTTSAPSLAMSRGVASPMPLPAPVTIATLLSRRFTRRVSQPRRASLAAVSATRVRGSGVVMLSLRMLSIECFSGFPDLLDDDVAVSDLDDLLDARVFVTGRDHEVIALVRDGSVLARNDLDRLEAARSVALAVEGNAPGDAEARSALLDALVDTPEHLLVPRCAFGEVHAGGVPRWAHLPHVGPSAPQDVEVQRRAPNRLGP